MTCLALTRPVSGAMPALRTLPVPLPQLMTPQALRELERALEGEIEYASWTPDPGAIEYASWTLPCTA